MQNETFTIRFVDVTPEDANKYASELRREIEEISPDVRVEIRKEDKAAQDFGATLVLVLGTGAAIAVAQGIADWLRKRTSACITVTRAGTQAVASGVSSKDAVRIANIFAVDHEDPKP